MNLIFIYSVEVLLLSIYLCIWSFAYMVIVRVITYQRYLSWLGHVLCCPSQELAHISLFANPCDGWCQKCGRRKIWTDMREYTGGSSSATYRLSLLEKKSLSNMASGLATWKCFNRGLTFSKCSQPNHQWCRLFAYEHFPQFLFS